MLSRIVVSLCCIQFFVNAGIAQQGQQYEPRIAAVLQEISDVTAARTALTTKMSQYRNDYDRVKRQEQELKAACNCRAHNDYAFNAFLQKDVPSFGQGMEVPFTNVTLNNGNAYDVRHSTFRAPVNGTYHFEVTIGTAATHTVAVDLVYNGKPVMKTRTSSDHTWRMTTNTMIIYLKAGDDVWVQHSATTDSNYLYVGDGLYSSFSGNLISSG